jgi:hypothetical protein
MNGRPNQVGTWFDVAQTDPKRRKELTTKFRGMSEGSKRRLLVYRGPVLYRPSFGNSPAD